MAESAAWKLKELGLFKGDIQLELEAISTSFNWDCRLIVRRVTRQFSRRLRKLTKDMESRIINVTENQVFIQIGTESYHFSISMDFDTEELSLVELEMRDQLGDQILSELNKVCKR